MQPGWMECPSCRRPVDPTKGLRNVHVDNGRIIGGTCENCELGAMGVPANVLSFDEGKMIGINDKITNLENRVADLESKLNKAVDVA